MGALRIGGSVVCKRLIEILGWLGDASSRQGVGPRTQQCRFAVSSEVEVWGRESGEEDRVLATIGTGTLPITSPACDGFGFLGM